MDDSNKKKRTVFNLTSDYTKLAFYQKSDVLYQMTVVFCRRFLPKYGDRTVDQMVQAARSGKQNIIEGIEDGMTSTETHLQLMNVARGSLQELRADYLDYLKSHNLPIWKKSYERFGRMLNYCRTHNTLEEYQPFFEKWSDEEFCNVAVSLCHFVDKMMKNYLESVQKAFIEHGGIRENMHRERTGYRSEVDEKIKMLEMENERLKNILRENGIEF